ncbi:hypothetical protein SporoP37_15740 [Sporosarcina sp. P37]|nr:hypothetical protein SporoP37_15740 [Sporosarcina sp. P37]
MMIIDGEKVCPACECQKETEALEKKESDRLNAADQNQKHSMFKRDSILTDIGLLEASFKTYIAEQPEETANKEKAAEAFRRYKQEQVFNTWLVGNPGVGKSHLAMSILRNCNEMGTRDKSCLFVSVDEMLLRIRSSFSDKESKYTEFYFIDLLTKADFLVLDDLGAETGGTGTEKKATDFTMRVLYGIANGRQNKPTIITSNLSLIALEKMYDPKLVSRLMRNTFLIRFRETTDKRIRNITF